MYSNKLAVALKSAGKVLREFGDQVYVPFGTEYSILIKNLNTVRALVTVTVDGEDVGDGTRFVIGPKESVDLERFIKNGNFDAGNRFKFIERTGAVENHRGVGIEDGLIQIEYQFERPQPTLTYYNTYWTDNTVGPYYGSASGKNVLRSRGTAGDVVGQATYTTSASSEQPVVSNSVNVNLVQDNDQGITVEGSISDQKFVDTAWFPVETETHSIVLKILGETKDNVTVRKPVTVKTKPKCTTCNTANKATAKFCVECGTSLNIV